MLSPKAVSKSSDQNVESKSSVNRPPWETFSADVFLPESSGSNPQLCQLCLWFSIFDWNFIKLVTHILFAIWYLSTPVYFGGVQDLLPEWNISLFLKSTLPIFPIFQLFQLICLYFLNQLLRNLSENSRKVTRTGRQPRTCESDYPKTENRNQKLDKRNQKKRKQMQEIRNVSKTGRQPRTCKSDFPIAFSILNTLPWSMSWSIR